MSFGSEARAEVGRALCGDKCCAAAELAAALLTCEGISYRFGSTSKYLLSMTMSEAACVRHYFQLLRRFFNVSAQIRTLRSNTLRGSTRYQLLIPEECGEKILSESGLMDEGSLFGIAGVPDHSVVSRECCRKAFIKSTFMISGGIASPERQYHAEVVVPTEVLADFIINQLKIYEINAKKACRKSKYVVYLKSGDGVSDMLSLIGASQAVFALYNARAKKDVHNHVNRQMNCDAANIGRVMETAGAQIEAIKYIDEKIGLGRLPEQLREIAEIRLENSATSLAGLGERLSKPIGKSGVNARLKKLTEIAEKLKNGEEIRF